MFETERERDRDRRLPTWAAVVVGVITVVAGVLALALPGITLAVLDVLFGVAVLVGGITTLVDSIIGPPRSDRGVHATLGMIGIVVALAALRYPGDALLVFVAVAGTWLVLSGFAGFVNAVADDAPGRGWSALGGVVDVLIGIAILSWPAIGIAWLTVLVGLSLVVRGGVTVITAFSDRRARRRADTPRPPARPRAAVG